MFEWNEDYFEVYFDEQIVGENDADEMMIEQVNVELCSRNNNRWAWSTKNKLYSATGTEDGLLLSFGKIAEVKRKIFIGN